MSSCCGFFMAVLHLPVERAAVVNSFCLILLSLGKLSPIHHAKGSVKTWSGWEYPRRQFGLVSKVTYGRIKPPLFLETEQTCCWFGGQTVIRPLFFFLRNLPRPLVPVILTSPCHPACVPLIFLSVSCPPCHFLATQHVSDRIHHLQLPPATLDSQTCTPLKPKQTTSLSPVLGLVPPFFSSSSWTIMATIYPSSSSAFCSPGHGITDTGSLFPLHSLCHHGHAGWVADIVPSCVGSPVSPSLVSLFSHAS